MKPLKINIKTVILIYVIFFPILPFYFMISNICISNLVCLFVGIIGIIILYKYNSQWFFKIDFLTFILLIWIFTRTFSFLYSKQYMEAVWFLFRTFICGIILVFGIKDRIFFLKVIHVLVYTAGVIAIWGIIESVTHFNIFSLLNTSGASLNYNPLRFGLLRILSFTSQTIVYCVYTMFIMSLAFYALSVEKHRKNKFQFKIIYVLLFINGMLTLSRSAVIALIASQLMLLYGYGYVELIKRLIQIIAGGIIIYMLLALTAPSVAQIGSNLFLMFGAIFSDNLTQTISSAFGSDNLTGIGHRFDLYTWVWESVRGSLFLGKGSNAEFAYEYTAHYGIYDVEEIKTSIEVQYLYILYHFGILGLITEVIAYIALLIKSLKMKFCPASWEGKISFSYVCFCIFLPYYIEMFAVNQSSEARTFFVVVMLFLAYIKHSKFETKEE